MKNIFKKAASFIAAAALAATAILPSFSSLTASAAPGNYYTATCDNAHPLTNTSSGGSTADGVYKIELNGVGRVFCAGYMKSITYGSNQYKEVNKDTNSFFNRDQQAAINAVCYYGYGSHKTDVDYIATQCLIWDIVTPIPGNSNLIPRNPKTLELQGAASDNVNNPKHCFVYVANAAKNDRATVIKRYQEILAAAKSYLTSHPSGTVNAKTPKTYTLKYNSVAGYTTKYAVAIPYSELKVFTEENISSFAGGCSGKVNCTNDSANSRYILWINPEAVKSFGSPVITYNRVFGTGPNYREWHNKDSSKQPFVLSSQRDPMVENVRLNVLPGEEILSLKKVSTDGNFISGIKFRVVGNGVDKTATTNATGEASFGNMPLGTYTVSEDGTTVNKAYGVASSQTVVLDTPNTTKTVTFSNALRYGEISISKVDDLGNIVPNVKFNVINKNGAAITYGGKSYEDGAVIATLTTDATGKASISNLPFISGKGKYIVKETGEYNPYIVTEQEQTVEFDTSNWGASRVYETKNYTFTNKAQHGSLTITKVDNETKKPITSDTAEFDIQAADDFSINGKQIHVKGDIVDHIVTDKATGKATTNKLYAGAKYNVIETKAPKNYVLQKTARPVTIAWNKTANLEYVSTTTSVGNDWQNGNITVFKYRLDKNGDKTEEKVYLPNAEFTLIASTDVLLSDGTVLYQANKPIEVVKTDANGKATFKSVPVGYKYIVTETKAPDGYVNAYLSKEFTLSYNSEVEFVEAPAENFENTPTRVYISKQRLGDNAEVKDAQMKLLDKDKKVVDSWTSNGSEHLIEKLVPGTYTIHEERQHNGYVIAEDISFTIVDQNNVSIIGNVEIQYKNGIPLIVMHDDQTVVEISKTDVATTEEIEGAKLVVYDKNNKVVDSWTSEANKSHKIVGKLVVGESYRLVETAAPDGYLISNEITFKVEGRTNNGKAIVQKVEMKDDYTKLSIKKTDKETGKTLAGAVLQLIDSTGKVYKQWTTKTTAERIDRIPLGIYTLHEVSAPKGYVKFADRTIEIKAEDFENGKIKNVTVADGITHVKIEKTSITDGKSVIGAHLVIKDSNGDVFAEWDTEDEAFTIKRMPVGKYTLTETYAPDGFVISNTVSFTVNEKEVIQRVNMIDDMTKVKIDKFEAKEGKNLIGAVLQIIDTTNEEVVEEWITDGTSRNIIGKLVAGRKYILREVSAPLGYVVADDVEFTVSTAGKEDYTSITDNTTQIDFSKKSITGEDELPGAKLAVYDSDDNKIAEWVSEDKPHVLEGILKAGGTYKLVEVIPADGFTTAESIEFTVTEKNEIQHVVMRDKPTEVEFSKKSITGDDELPGARLTVFDSENNKIAEWTSGDKPYVLKGVLKVGQKYRLHEEIAPDGYIVANDIEFEVIDQRTVQHVTMVDDTTKVEVSKKSATGKDELPGAKLQILDASGEVIVEWTSSNKPYMIEGILKAGETYTLHEDLAPLGYQKASDIKFKVNDDGSVTKVEMIDEVIPKTGVTYDITVPVTIASISAAIMAIALFILLKRKNSKKNS